MKERIVRELHSPSWKNGTPATDQRGSGAIKYIRLESYEDATFNWLLGLARIIHEDRNEEF